MINQQLIDYILQQTTMGVTKETIKIALISQGWSEQDIIEGFSTTEKLSLGHISQSPSPLQKTAEIGSTIWTKGIPRTNIVFMIISLILIFGVDLMIIINSPDLKPFWYMMLGVLALFGLFFYLENFVFNKKFANTHSNLDKGISLIIVLRNLLFLLNFIPFIQLIGLAGLAFVGWIIALIYIGLIIARFNQTKKLLASSI